MSLSVLHVVAGCPMLFHERRLLIMIVMDTKKLCVWSQCVTMKYTAYSLCRIFGGVVESGCSYGARGF